MIKSEKDIKLLLQSNHIKLRLIPVTLCLYLDQCKD